MFSQRHSSSALINGKNMRRLKIDDYVGSLTTIWRPKKRRTNTTNSLTTDKIRLSLSTLLSTFLALLFTYSVVVSVVQVQLVRLRRK